MPAQIPFNDAFDAFLQQVCARRPFTEPRPSEADKLLREAFFSGTAFMLGAIMHAESMEPAARKAFIDGLREQQQQMRAIIESL